MNPLSSTRIVVATCISTCLAVLPTLAHCAATSEDDKPKPDLQVSWQRHGQQLGLRITLADARRSQRTLAKGAWWARWHDPQFLAWRSTLARLPWLDRTDWHQLQDGKGRLILRHLNQAGQERSTASWLDALLAALSAGGQGSARWTVADSTLIEQAQGSLAGPAASGIAADLRRRLPSSAAVRALVQLQALDRDCTKQLLQAVLPAQTAAWQEALMQGIGKDPQSAAGALVDGLMVPDGILAWPRNAALDRLILELPQAHGPVRVTGDGAIRSLTIPAYGWQLVLGRTKDHWLLATSKAMVQAWLHPASQAAAAEDNLQIWAEADRDRTCAIAKQLVSYLAIALRLEQTERLYTLIDDLRSLPRQQHLSLTHHRGQWHWSCTGLPIGPLGVLLTWAHLDKHHPGLPLFSNEELAAARLQYLLFPAIRAYQKSAGDDPDNNGIGAFPILTQLCGQLPSRDDKRIRLLSKHWETAEKTGLDGYRYQLWLPTGDQTASTRPDHIQHRQEQQFLLYAWPIDQPEQRSFLLTPNGIVHAQITSAGQEHPWHSALPRPHWDAPVSWPRLGTQAANKNFATDNAAPAPR